MVLSGSGMSRKWNLGKSFRKLRKSAQTESAVSSERAAQPSTKSIGRLRSLPSIRPAFRHRNTSIRFKPPPLSMSSRQLCQMRRSHRPPLRSALGPCASVCSVSRMAVARRSLSTFSTSADASPMRRELTFATPEHEAGGEQQSHAEHHTVDGLHDDCNQQLPT